MISIPVYFQSRVNVSGMKVPLSPRDFFEVLWRKNVVLAYSGNIASPK